MTSIHTQLHDQLWGFWRYLCYKCYDCQTWGFIGSSALYFHCHGGRFHFLNNQYRTLCYSLRWFVEPYYTSSCSQSFSTVHHYDVFLSIFFPNTSFHIYTHMRAQAHKHTRSLTHSLTHRCTHTWNTFGNTIIQFNVHRHLMMLSEGKQRLRLFTCH